MDTGYMEGFAINRGVGFSIKFNNGVVVSVQFGSYHHCSNQGSAADEFLQGTMTIRHGIITDTDRHDCKDAEVAIFNDKGWLTKEFKDQGDDVLSYQSPDDVAEAIKWAQAYKQ